jgi:Na+/phosphate symporter
MIQGLQHKRSIHRRIKHMCRTMNELEKVVADYRSLKALKEQLEEELKAVEREIIGYMDTNEKVSEIGNNFTIKLSTCERKTLDNKRLEILTMITLDCVKFHK